MGVIDSAKQLWQKFRASPATLNARFRIPPAQIDKSLGESFVPEQQYFVVRVNELFLRNQREWFTTYLPMVTTLSEFHYNKEPQQVLPFLVGPELVEKRGVKIPDTGMVFSNTRVAGVHPYRGGRISLTVILYRVKRTDYSRKMLNVIEKTAGALDFGTGLSTYLKVADAVLAGIEALFETEPVEPLTGFRTEIDPDAGDDLSPGYFAIINAPENVYQPSRFWVKEGKLQMGDSSAAAKPFREADYVLYSLGQTVERSDVAALPFQELWERIRAEARGRTEEHWKSAQIQLGTLLEVITTSPDLTEKQGDLLCDKYQKDVEVLHDTTVKTTPMGADVPQENPRLVKARTRAVAILNKI